MATPACCFAFLGRRGRRAHAAPWAAEAGRRGLAAECEALPPDEPITTFSLGGSLLRLANGVEAWDGRRFAFSHKLQEAPRNSGRVDAMREVWTGGFVAVKRMPNWWMRSSPDEFWQKHPQEMEQPWVDLGVLLELNRRRFPYACDFLGLFSDGRETFVVMSLAAGGDLHSWVQGLPAKHLEREEEMAPVVAQLCEAVGMLHDVGIAHRDLSLENVLLDHSNAIPGAPVQVKLIDFGMSMIGRVQGSDSHRTAVGKACYCAPELQVPGVFDAFLADAFSVGVIVYCMMVWDYPWSTTRPGASASMEHAKKVGMQAHLRLWRVGGAPLSSFVSRELLELLTGLLELDPARRLCLGKACMLQDGRQSALDSAWLRAARLAVEHELPAVARYAISKQADGVGVDMADDQSTASFASFQSESADSLEDLLSPTTRGATAAGAVGFLLEV